MTPAIILLILSLACPVMAQKWEAGVAVLKSGTNEEFTILAERKGVLATASLGFDKGLAEISFEAKGNVPIKYALFGQSGTALGSSIPLSDEWKKYTFPYYFETTLVRMQFISQDKGEFSMRQFSITPARLPDFKESEVPAIDQDISIGKHGDKEHHVRQGKRWYRLLTMVPPLSSKPIYLFLELKTNGLGNPGIELRRGFQPVGRAVCRSETDWQWVKLGPLSARALCPDFDVCITGNEETVVSVARAVMTTDPNWKAEDGATKVAEPPSLQVGRGTTGIHAAPFIRLKEKQFANDPTTLKVTYDDQGLQVEFFCHEKALDPTANRLHEFKSELPKVRDNDYVVFLLKRGKIVYDFFVTAAAQLECAQSEGPDYWDKRDSSWKTKAKATASIGNGFWKARLEIPWHDLGGMPKPDEEWRFQAGRTARPGKEISLLFPTIAGFHADKDFGTLIFTESVPEIKPELPEFLPGNNTIHADNAAVSGKVNFVGYHPVFFFRNTFQLAKTGNFQFSWRLYDPVTLQVFFKSPEYHLSTTAIPIEFEADNEISLNGTKVTSGAVLNDGMNILNVKMPFKGAITANGTAILPPAETFTLAVNTTLLWPNWQSHEVAIPRGGLQMLLFSPRGYPGMTLNDYSIKLHLPPGFKLECASGYYQNYELQYTADGLIRFQTEIPYKKVLPSHKFIAAFIRAPKEFPDSTASIRFAAGSEENHVIEVPQTLTIRLLPELDGRQPKNLIISLSCSWLKNLTDKAYLDTVTKEFKLAGINLLNTLPNSHIPHFYMFNFAEWSWPLSPFVKQHPEAALTLKDGQKNKQLVCPQHIRGKEFEQWLDTQMPEWFKKAGNPSCIEWDYEYGYDTGPFSCYCPECSKMTDVVSRNRTVADFACLLRTAIKKYRPNTPLIVYSGYQSTRTKIIYGVDWAMLKDCIDIASCGYGRPVSEIAATYQAIGDIPLVTGAIITPYDSTSRAYPNQYSAAWLLRHAADATGGILLYEYPSMDGNSLRAVCVVSRIMARYEDFFRFGKRLPDTIPGWPEADVQFIEHQGKRLLVLMNSGKTVRQYHGKNIPAGEVLVELL